uniref:Uncharacterized protein n=1 Tax=Ditylenchus dipsaci TaxID=166011 RepID=A0A915CXD8_9BILA
MQKGHSLTESYQLSENIRTGRQLAPTFFFHFLNTIAVAIASILFVYLLTTAKSKQISLVALFLTMTIGNLGILTTVIRYHPILNRRAVKLCNDLKAKMFGNLYKKSSHISHRPEARVSVIHPAPTTIDGNSLINTLEMEEYLEFYEFPGIILQVFNDIISTQETLIVTTILLSLFMC